ncbi:hypothetical protein DL93DRAFT_2078052 [Clavulina sp. PMI_390]|nr:hypothetical protein DL93DRAFT_2078052 [Clavulina sp. PMI_390]
MSLRCPSSPYIGVARLDGWRFIINQRGVATIVPSDPNSADDKGNHVFGLAYDLAEIDEETLDINEGVPFQYIKEYMRVRLWDGRKVDDAGVPIIPDVSTDIGSEEVDALVYVDVKRITEGKPREEYIYRMGMGIRDGIAKGIPKSYFDKFLRGFIPEKGNEELDEVAKPRVIQHPQDSA